MQAAVYEGIDKIVVKQVDRPQCPENSVLIRVHACAICGTDLRTFHHGKSNVKPPQILGHEIAGEIVELGTQLGNRPLPVPTVTSGSVDYQVGDRVSVAAIIACGTCYFCNRGLQNLCQNFTALGYEHPGGFAELMAIPAPMLNDGSVNIIPPDLSYDEAAVAEPFACAINGQELSDIKLGETVLIIGTGPIGCMHIELAKVHGAGRIIVADISPSRLKIAEQFGADNYINVGTDNLVDTVNRLTDTRGADVIIVAAPSGKAQEDALKMVAYRGRINFFGGLPKDKPYIQLDSNIVHYKEIFIHGTSGSLPRHNQVAIQLFSTGRVNAKKLVTHRIPLNQILDGFKTVESGTGLKVVVHP